MGSWPSKHKDTSGFEVFRFDNLAKATGYWSNKYCLGDGGFGAVYMGEINNQTVAIKKLKFNSTDKLGDDRNFVTEVTALIAVHHENLVKFIGYCTEDKNRVLVCEYCQEGSLRLHLHADPVEGQPVKDTLSWKIRLQIAIGSAKALEYLHEKCETKIIHRDIKADNIVLDQNFQPKVVDFGLAKLFPDSGSVSHISSLMKGTEVYADPENSPNQKVSDKSDVYSFGVVLLELISGRKPEFKTETEGITILDWAKPLILQVISSNEINIRELIDPKLSQEEMEQHKSEMEMMLFCAAASVYKPSEFRPKMSRIVQALEMQIPLNEIWNTDKDSAFLKPK